MLRHWCDLKLFWVSVGNQHAWTLNFVYWQIFFTARRNADIAIAVLAAAIPSVCPSVTRRYCVKTTAHSTVQFALSDNKMCLVLYKPKNIPQGRPLHPEILAPSDLPSPDNSESSHVLPCSTSTVRASEKSSNMTNRKSFTGFPTSYRWSVYVTSKSSICTLLSVSGFIPIRLVAGPSVNSCIVNVC